MIKFILNQQPVSTSLPAGSTVLDFVREHKRLTGTKTGCREGDCGACTVLVGSLDGDKIQYQSMTSCLMPLGNAHGKHIVTVEGINMGKNLSPVQSALVQTQGTQCGFCTIGFVMSLTGFVLSEKAPNYPAAIAAIDGNICRCTGYKSIERAAALLCESMQTKNAEMPIQWAVDAGFVPAYFAEIPAKLAALHGNLSAAQANAPQSDAQPDFWLGGGTDLLVQRPEKVQKSSVNLIFERHSAPKISLEAPDNSICRLNGNTTATEFAASEIIRAIFPQIADIIRLISSTPIRNMATMAGNIVNASPIGDMTSFFMALDAELELWDSLSDQRRRVKLRDFYLGYKQLDKSGAEIIDNIRFAVPSQAHKFNFEKLSKREHLDIASVNTSCLLQIEAGHIKSIGLSAGGVAATPKYLAQTCAFLVGKPTNAENIAQALDIMQTEVAPISDARGTADYKRLLLRRLVLGHFINCVGLETVAPLV